MMSGGWSLRASVMLACSAGIALSESIVRASPNSFEAINEACSETAGSSAAERCASISYPVQLDVIELVCCPANSVAISMPVISSSVRARPLKTEGEYRASMNDWRMSSSLGAPAACAARRAAMIVLNTAASSARAASRLRWAAMGA